MYFQSRIPNTSSYSNLLKEMLKELYPIILIRKKYIY